MIPQLQDVPKSDIFETYKSLCKASDQNNDGIKQLISKIEMSDYSEKIQLLYFYRQLQLNKHEQLLSNNSLSYSQLFRQIEDQKQLEGSILISNYSEFATLCITTSDSFNFDTISDETLQKLFLNIENRIQKIYIQDCDYEMLEIAIVMNAKTKQIHKTFTPSTEFFKQFVNDDEYFVILQTESQIDNVGDLKIKYLCFNNTDDIQNITLSYPKCLQSVHIIKCHIINLHDCINLQNLSSDRNQFQGKELIALKQLKRFYSIFDNFIDPKQIFEQIVPQLEYLDVYFDDSPQPLHLNLTLQQSRYLQIQFGQDNQNHKVEITVGPNQEQQFYYLSVLNSALIIKNANKQTINIQTAQHDLLIDQLQKLKQKNPQNNIYQVMQQALEQKIINNKKDFLLNQFVNQYFKVVGIATYMYLKNIKRVSQLNEQQVEQSYHLNNDDYIYNYTQQIGPYVTCQNLKHLQAVIDFSKELDIFSFSLRFNTDFRFNDISDDIWNQIFDLAEDHVMQCSFVMDCDDVVNISVARDIKNKTIIRQEEVSNQTLSNLTNDNTYDLFISSNENLPQLENIKLRSFICVSSEQKLTLKYPAELKSVSLNYSQILNFEQCSQLAIASVQGNVDYSSIGALSTITRFASEQNTYNDLVKFLDQLFENNKQLQYVTFINLDNQLNNYVIKSQMSNLKVFYFDVYESNDASLPRFMAENFKNEKVEYAYTYDVLSNRIMQAKDTTGKALKMRYVL